MKQVLIKKGKALSKLIPDATVSRGNILISVNYSCISIGTELRGVSEAGKSLIKKAMENPDKIRQFIKIVQTQGFQVAYNKLNERNKVQIPIGY